MIKLRRLELTNFRRFPSAVIDFDDGIIGILGPNGSGKSTIVEALGFALYGSQPVLTRTGKDDMKRSDAPDVEGWGVVLEFDQGDDRWTIIRKTKGSTEKYRSEVRLLKNGAQYAKDDTAVRAKVGEILGMDFQSFDSSVFCRQAEVAALSGLLSSDRKRLVLRMLRILGIEDALKNLRSDKKDMTSKSEILDDMLSGSIESLGSELEDRKKELLVIEESIKGLVSDKERIEKELEGLSDRSSGLLSERSVIDKERKELEEKRLAVERISVIESDIGQLDDSIKKVEASRISYDRMAIDSIPGLEREIVSVRGNKKALEVSLSKSKSRIEELRGLGRTCPTCEQPISEEHSHSLIESETDAVNRAEEDIEAMESKIDELELLLSNARTERDKKSNDDGFGREVSSLRDSLSRKRTELASKKKISFDPVRYDEINKDISRLDKELKDNTSDVKRVQSDLANANRKLSDARSSKASLDTRIEDISKKMAERRDSQKKLDEYSKKLEKIGMAEELMSDFRLFLIGRVRPMLSMFTSDMVSKMTNGRYIKVELDEDYNISMYDKGIPYPLSRFSGGEQSIVNLSLRLALSQMIAVQTEREGLGFIILDEVFGSSDTKRRESVIETLSGLKNIYSQIICITHIESVVDMIPNAIHVEVDGSVSKLVRV